MAIATGRPISELQAEHDRPAPPTVAVLALDRPRPLLRDRIDRRVDAMIADGLVDEVRRLTKGPRPLHPVPAQAVGYREILELLAGRIAGLDEAADRIRARTRQFAKRQGTWFRSLVEVEPLPVPEAEPPERTADRLADRIAAIEAGDGRRSTDR